MTTLPHRRFVRSGLEVSALGFGAAPLGDLYALLDEAAAVDAIVAALQSGITLIDVSPLYGHGLAEHRIGSALRRMSGPRPVISTKVGRVMEPFAPRGDGSGYRGGLPHGARFDYSADGVKRSLEQSLLRLGVDRIDIALIHDVDVWTHGPEAAGRRIREALDGAYPALEALRAEGVISAIGIGVNEADICTLFARETDMDAVLLAGRYSLLEQPALDEFLPLAVEKRIGVMLGGVFNSGILATGAVPGAKYNYQPASEPILARVRAIETVCARHDVPLRVAALAFALAHPAVTSVVLGGVNRAEVLANVEAAGAHVPPALWAELQDAGLINPAAPTPGV
ncbi:MAG: aldo/keto reductase [Proteobacteria bacterium]|nr:aldo/keto reductase [Pseudomonadota bacterium]